MTETDIIPDVEAATAKLLETAPQGAFFVCADEVEAAVLRRAAKAMERQDLVITTPQVIEARSLKAWALPVVVDRKVELDPTQEAVLAKHRQYMKTYVPPKEKAK